MRHFRHIAIGWISFDNFLRAPANDDATNMSSDQQQQVDGSAAPTQQTAGQPPAGVPSNQLQQIAIAMARDETHPLISQLTPQQTAQVRIQSTYFKIKKNIADWTESLNNVRTELARTDLPEEERTKLQQYEQRAVTQIANSDSTLRRMVQATQQRASQAQQQQQQQQQQMQNQTPGQPLQPVPSVEKLSRKADAAAAAAATHSSSPKLATKPGVGTNKDATLTTGETKDDAPKPSLSAPYLPPASAAPSTAQPPPPAPSATISQAALGTVAANVAPPRPTLSGGYAVGTPVLGTPPVVRPPLQVDIDSGTKLLSKRKLQELVKQIDPEERLEPDVEDVSEAPAWSTINNCLVAT